MPTVSADALQDRTIYATGRVPKLRWPEDNAPVIGWIEAGQRIGVIHTWMRRRDGSKFWYWAIREKVNGAYADFYVPHDRNRLNLPRLHQDYQDSQEQQRRERMEWWERAAEAGGAAVSRTSNQILSGAFVLGALYVFGRLIRDK